MSQADVQPSGLGSGDYVRDAETIEQAFDSYRHDPLARFQVTIRRHRAQQLRQLLSQPEQITLEMFNRELWPYETDTLLDGMSIKGQLQVVGEDAITPDRANQLLDALASARLELHGNNVWGSGSRVYGSALRTDEAQKLQYVRDALRVLNDSSLAPLEKAERLEKFAGFGPNVSTGLVMLFHPAEFAIWNKQSISALEQLGYPAQTLGAFEESAQRLKDKLKADDFLELDWFLYLIAQGEIKVTNLGLVRGQKVWVIALGEGARLWKQSYEEGLISIGWDFLHDKSKYPDKAAIERAIREEHKTDKRPTNEALSCWQFVRKMKPGDYVLSKRGRSILLGVGRVES